MTLIVGLIARDGIVMASESEESTGYTAKRNVGKLWLETGEDWAVVIGGAGDAALIDNASRRISNALRGEVHLTHSSLQSVADEVLGTVHSAYIDLDPQRPPLELVLGASCADKLHLLCATGRTTQFCDGFACAGIGQDVAIYLLDRIDFRGADWRFGVVTAGFVLRQAKESSRSCSGPSQVCVLQAPPEPRWRWPGWEWVHDLDNDSHIDIGELLTGYLKRSCSVPDLEELEPVS